MAVNLHTSEGGHHFNGGVVFPIRDYDTLRDRMQAPPVARSRLRRGLGFLRFAVVVTVLSAFNLKGSK